VIVRQGDDHDGANDDLTVDNDRLLLDRVHTEDSGLGKVDAAVRTIPRLNLHGSTVERTENSAVGNGE